MRFSFVTIFSLCSILSFAQRSEVVVRNWRFSHSDSPEQSAVTFDDRRWQRVCVPHDWAIDGPFDKEIDKQVVAIVQNGETEATEKTGRSGCLPWIGTGWYRTNVTIAPDVETAILNFDGAMAEPVVYVNGRKAGEWKYGYSAFNIDITPFVNRNGSDNVIAVRLQNIEESSRWYPGAGLYRPVTLITKHRTSLSEWGVTAVTDGIYDATKVCESLCATVDNAEGKDLDVDFIITPPAERSITWRGRCRVVGGKAMTKAEIEGVQLWSPESPCLYNLTTQLVDRATGEVLDTKQQRIGFRTVNYSASAGFQLNGVSRKFKGVCLHHDLGMLGSAVNKAALVRQVELLKSMGCDAIRTSHNMPSQMQMDVCDSLGMMVMAESFDMWIYPKCKNGYARFFDKKEEGSDETWAQRDIRNLVRANKLHPSIVMWSIGNEIPEQGMENGAALVRMLQNVVHEEDPDAHRLVTTGMDNIDGALRTGFAQVIDIPGMNYRTHKYDKAYHRLGHGFVLGSETASTVSSRGVYKFDDSKDNPVQRLDNHAYADGQCSSYDTEACWWANIPEDDWILQDDRDWVIGEFVWTGFDYLGEPTPYDEYWPSRSSYFGIFDLAGLPKDRYYLYRSRWNTAVPTVHLLPHWTFPGREGKVTPVYCYTNYPSAELFVNGKSQGRISKRQDVHRDSIGTRTTDINDPLIDRYRLRWNNVRYEPGVLKVVAYDDEGRAVATEEVHTAGKPHHLVLTGDMGDEVDFLKCDGEDMVFVTVNVVDKDGNLCPDADVQVRVDVKGGGRFKAICNGDATSLEPFTKPTMRTFHGQLVIGIQSTDIPQPAAVSVKAAGLKAAKIYIPCVVTDN